MILFKKNQLKNKSHIPFFLLGFLILVLIIISIYDRICPFEKINPYTTPFVIVLWVVLSLCAMNYILYRKLHKRFSVFLLHVSFIIMLIGALFTHIWGFSGYIHLREDESGNRLYSETGLLFQDTLPFSLYLDSFAIVTYPGTNTPADYYSSIKLICKEKSIDESVSLNHIVKYKGYRIFQYSYDKDLKGTVLKISYDKWGVLLSYLSYILLLISMILVLFDSNSKFRKAIKSPLWKSLILLLLLSPFCFEYSSASSRTLSQKEAEALGDVMVEYQGRITSIDHLSIDFTKKLTGKDSYQGYTATQVLFGMLMSYEEWQYEPMIKIKGEIQKSLLNTDSSYVRITDFYAADKTYKLSNLNVDEKTMKNRMVLDEKVQLIRMLRNGSLLKILPVKKSGAVRLCAATDFHLPNNIIGDSLNYFLPLLYDTYSHHQDCTPLIHKFAQYQLQQLDVCAPSVFQRNVEKIYLHTNHIPICCYVILAMGLFAFIFVCVGKRKDMLDKLFYGSLILSFIYLTYLFILRWILSESIPLSNGYETLLAIAWLAQLIALLFSRKMKVLLPLGLIISGMTLLTATLVDRDPQITPLMPILNSPLLSVHVSLMMIAYTLFFFITFSSIIAVVTFAREKTVFVLEQHQTLNIVLLYPAVFCLTIGIFLGAVWANVSWGSYWSWDPKETWALISLLVYSFSFHSDSLSFLQKSKLFHVYMIVAFLFILITYFGVNYLFGGMHSYGA